MRLLILLQVSNLSHTSATPLKEIVLRLFEAAKRGLHCVHSPISSAKWIARQCNTLMGPFSVQPSAFSLSATYVHPWTSLGKSCVFSSPSGSVCPARCFGDRTGPWPCDPQCPAWSGHSPSPELALGCMAPPLHPLPVHGTQSFGRREFFWKKSPVPKVHQIETYFLDPIGKCWCHHWYFRTTKDLLHDTLATGIKGLKGWQALPYDRAEPQLQVCEVLYRRTNCSSMSCFY